MYFITVRAYITLFFSIIVCTLHTQVNTFHAKIGFGVSASQMNGDTLYGYQHLGILTSLQTEINFYEKWKGIVKLSYRQSGAANRTSFPFRKDNTLYRYIDLSYAEVSTLVGYREWVKDSRDILTPLLGLKFGRLLNAKTKHGEIGRLASKYNSNQFSATIGVEFRIYKALRFQFLYERALHPLYESTIYKLSPYSLNFEFLCDIGVEKKGH